MTLVSREEKLRKALLAETCRCSGCNRPFSTADVARQTSIDYSSLHKFLRGKHKSIYPVAMEKLEKWLRELR